MSMYQLDLATWCPDICSNIILNMSVSLFLDEINIYFKLIGLNRTKGLREFLLPDCFVRQTW